MRRFCHLILFIILTTITFTACSAENIFEVDTEIDVIVLNDVGSQVSIEYHLGPLLMLDDLKDLSTAQALYLRKHKDELQLSVLIQYEDSMGQPTTKYTYYMSGTQIEHKCCRGSKGERLMKYDDQIPGFKWTRRNGRTMKHGETKKELPNIGGEDNLL